MSKVLIDRALLERAVYGLELAYETDTPTVRDICAVLSAPSGTPAMPVKAYYHEAPNEYGGFNKSVGLEVRKQFADTPLVLEADALARIACLEGEIAKRDEELTACRVAVENCELFRARIVELESDLTGTQSRVLSLQNQWRKLDAELSAIKAQGVVMPEGWIPLTIEHEPGYPEDVAFGPKRMMDRLKKWLDRYFEMRLNAAPVQQVSVPDGLELIKRMQVCLSLDDTEWGLSAPEKYKLLGDIKSYVLAAPAAPAADAGVTTNE